MLFTNRCGFIIISQNVSFLTAFYLLCLVLIIYPAEVRRVGCSYGTENGVSFADCSDLRLTNFPKDIRRSVEVGIN